MIKQSKLNKPGNTSIENEEMINIIENIINSLININKKKFK